MASTLAAVESAPVGAKRIVMVVWGGRGWGAPQSSSISRCTGEAMAATTKNSTNEGSSGVGSSFWAPGEAEQPPRRQSGFCPAARGPPAGDPVAGAELPYTCGARQRKRRAQRREQRREQRRSERRAGGVERKGRQNGRAGRTEGPAERKGGQNERAGRTGDSDLGRGLLAVPRKGRREGHTATTARAGGEDSGPGRARDPPRSHREGRTVRRRHETEGGWRPRRALWVRVCVWGGWAWEGFGCWGGVARGWVRKARAGRLV